MKVILKELIFGILSVGMGQAQRSSLVYMDIFYTLSEKFGWFKKIDKYIYIYCYSYII